LVSSKPDSIDDIYDCRIHYKLALMIRIPVACQPNVFNRIEVKGDVHQTR